MKKLLGVLMIGLLSACASTSEQTANIEDRDINANGGAGDANAMGSGSPNFHPLQDPNSILSQRSVYFDYDSYSVKSEYRELVTSHAQYLRDNANSKVLLQGNTDDRGSREYNLALGQRRADSVKHMMTLSGARDAQIESVSFGEEKPQAAGYDESVWSQNRRTDIIYRGE